MDCEVQEKVSGIRSRGTSHSSLGMCVLCGQVMGRGIQHPCSQREIQAARCKRQVERSRSLCRKSTNRRKRNLSLLVGREEEEAQEQIVSSAVNNIALRKGLKFRLKQMQGGGIEGRGKEFSVGEQTNSSTVLPIEVFKEIKTCLNQSKQKMNEMCYILQRHKVSMAANVHKKLWEIDDNYKTIKVNFT